MAEVPFRPVRQLSEYKGKGASASREVSKSTQFINSFSKKIISLTNTSSLIIAGDWNTTLNPLDKQGGLTWKETTHMKNEGSGTEILLSVFLPEMRLPCSPHFG